MRGIIVDFCYLHAGEDPVMSDACDLFEKDSNTLLWNSLDYTDMLAYNKHKYTFIYERMPEHLFDEMLEHFKPIKEDLDELLDEVEEHRMVVVSHVKEHVEKRTKGIMVFHDVFPGNPDHPLPKIRSYKLEVKQIIPSKHIEPIQIQVPRPLRMDGSTELFGEAKSLDEGLYGGNGSEKRPISVEKKFQGLAHDHAEKQAAQFFYAPEPEPQPTTAKMIKDLGEEAEGQPLPGEKPKPFMYEFLKSNEQQEYHKSMELAAFAHQNFRQDIPGHYYDQNPAEVAPMTRKLRRVRALRRRPRHWNHLV